MDTHTAAIANRPETAPEAGPALELRHVCKSYGAVRALQDVSLNVADGEFLSLLGPSGCGKTTLLYLIAGFVPPDSGEIVIAGRHATALPPRRRDIGVVFQNYALFPHMNVARNVAFGLRMRGVRGAEARRRVQQALETVRLTGMEHRLPRELSGGQQQRVALARALVIRPRVLLLDEPLSALDKNLRLRMQIELREIQRSVGITTIFVTHDQGEALTLSDRIAVMAEGRIQQLASPMDVYRHPASDFVASFVGEVNMLPGRIAALGAGEVMLDVAGGRVVLPAERCPGVRAGSAVRVFVRPECLHPAAETETPFLTGQVAAHVYQGGFVDIHCRVEGLGRVHLRTLGHDSLLRYPAGSPLPMRVAAEDLVVFPAPD